MDFCYNRHIFLCPKGIKGLTASVDVAKNEKSEPNIYLVEKKL